MVRKKEQCFGISHWHYQCSNICFITYENKIYAESGINIYYFIMSVYGWILWTSKNKKIKKNTSVCSKKENIMYLIAFLVFFLNTIISPKKYR